MTHTFIVSPFDGGWCLKVASTGEVMFFKTCGLAQRRGLAFAAEASSRGHAAEVLVQDMVGNPVGRWVDKHFHAAPIVDDGGLLAA